MGPFPFNLEFVSFLQYSPRGTSQTSRNSQRITYRIKADEYWGQTRIISHAAKRIEQKRAGYPFLNSCFGPDVTLVPMPRSEPRKPGALWPAQRICEVLAGEGLAGAVLPCLKRTKPVQKASAAAPGQRPEPPDHLASISVAQPGLLTSPTRLTVVDDVITRGSSFVGVVPHLQDSFPGVPVHCFALVRTISDTEVDQIISPVHGVITYQETTGHLERRP